MQAKSLQPKDAIRHFISTTSTIRIEQVSVGAIQRTYLVYIDEARDPSYVLQHMSHLFQPSLMEDIMSVCTYAEANAFTSFPKFIPTLDNGMWALPAGETWWRLMTYLTGTTYATAPSKTSVTSAAALVRKFHDATQNFTGKLQHSISHFHDTHWHIQQLSLLSSHLSQSHLPKDIQENITQASEFIQAEYKKHLNVNEHFKPQLIHSDLKFSNIRFAQDSSEATALIDLDTFMYGTLLVELGDALRSWCNVEGEDALEPVFDTSIYHAALDGYYGITEHKKIQERKAIAHGVALVTLELAARFFIDAVEERYFVLDSSIYSSLREQNMTRGNAQLTLYKDMLSKWALLI